MEIEFEKSRNELLKRTNVLVKMRSAKTPSKKELKTKVASVLACDESLVVVDKISQEFGSKSSSAYVKIYDDLTSLKKIELEHNIRDLLKEEKEKADLLKEERKSKKEAKEKPKEKVKDDVKEEAKDEVKDDVKEEAKDEAKDDAKEKPKDEAKDDAKDEAKEEPSKNEEEKKE
jgi:ribosomal protein S24E